MTDDPRSLTQPPRPGGQAADGTGAAGDTGQPAVDQVFDGDSLYALRAAVAAHAAEAGLPPGRVSDAVAAVHELAANAVRHGAGHGRLRIWHHDQVLRCLVTDDGTPPAVLPGGDGTVRDAGGAGVPAPCGPEGLAAAAGVTGAGPAGDGVAAGGWRTGFGHGLWLVGQLADDARLESGPGGTRASVAFTLHPPGPDAPFRLTQHPWNGCTVLAIAGQLEPRGADQVIDAVDDLLAGGAAPLLILDLAGLTLWDSSGVAALLAVQQRVDAHPPARLVLAGLPERLAQRLREAGLGARFTVTGSALDAVGLLTPEPGSE